jgi:hypothetical protein
MMVRKTRTGYVGHGEPIPLALGRAWLEALERDCPEMDHWLVAVA